VLWLQKRYNKFFSPSLLLLFLDTGSGSEQKSGSGIIILDPDSPSRVVKKKTLNLRSRGQLRTVLSLLYCQDLYPDPRLRKCLFRSLHASEPNFYWMPIRIRNGIKTMSIDMRTLLVLEKSEIFVNFVDWKVTMIPIRTRHDADPTRFGSDSAILV
jgi:hypothetical protein